MPTHTKDIKDHPKSDVIMSSFPKGGKGKKFFKSRFTLLLLISLAVIGIIVFVVLWHHNNLVAKKTINQPKVSAFLKSNNCSSKAQQSVSAEQPDPSRVQASITLLSYQASCLIQTAKYTEANQVLEQLKTYYAKENNLTAIASINQQITANNNAAAHPLKHIVNTPPDISPQDDKKINAFFGNSQ